MAIGPGVRSDEYPSQYRHESDIFSSDVKSVDLLILISSPYSPSSQVIADLTVEEMIMHGKIGMSTARKILDSSLPPAFDGRKAGQRRCSCDECKEVIDVLNDIEEVENDFAIERWKNEELARLNYA